MVPLLPSTAEDPIIRKDAAEDPFATAEAQLLFVQTSRSQDSCPKFCRSAARSLHHGELQGRGFEAKST